MVGNGSGFLSPCYTWLLSLRPLAHFFLQGGRSIAHGLTSFFTLLTKNSVVQNKSTGKTGSSEIVCSQNRRQKKSFRCSRTVLGRMTQQKMIVRDTKRKSCS